jgi:radical SAM-linked protein
MKLRIRYSRHGRIRFMSHRDTARVMERAFRTQRLPIAYTEGFSPRPKLSFGLALTVAHESEAEYLDLDLVTPVEIDGLAERLTAALPDGLTVDAVVPVEPRSLSLQQAIVCCGWRIEVIGSPIDDVTDAVAALLAAPERFLERERKGKTTTVDVRPAVISLEICGSSDDGVELFAVLANGDLTLRPSELVRLLGLDLSEGRVCRTNQWTNVDGERAEPIALFPTSAATAHQPTPLEASRPREIRAS